VQPSTRTARPRRHREGGRRPTIRVRPATSCLGTTAAPVTRTPHPTHATAAGVALATVTVTVTVTAMVVPVAAPTLCRATIAHRTSSSGWSGSWPRPKWRCTSAATAIARPRRYCLRTRLVARCSRWPVPHAVPPAQGIDSPRQATCSTSRRSTRPGVAALAAGGGRAAEQAQRGGTEAPAPHVVAPTARHTHGRRSPRRP